MRAHTVYNTVGRTTQVRADDCTPSVYTRTGGVFVSTRPATRDTRVRGRRSICRPFSGYTREHITPGGVDAFEPAGSGITGKPPSLGFPDRFPSSFAAGVRYGSRVDGARPRRRHSCTTSSRRSIFRVRKPRRPGAVPRTSSVVVSGRRV